MKIVQIISRMNRGGTASWLNDLTVGMRENGHEVMLLAGRVQLNEIEDESFHSNNGIRIQSLGKSVSIIRDFAAFIQIRKILKYERPDLVNTHTSKAGLIGRLAALSLGSKRPAIVHTFHGHLLYGYFPRIITHAIVIIERFLAARSDALIVSGQRVKLELLQSNIGEESKFVVMKPGVSIGLPISKEITLEKYNLPSGVFLVGWLGRLTKIKRADRVLELARQLSKLYFVIGGDGELLDELKANAPANVRFIGWTSPEELWGLVDVALLTSDNEAQPISLIEAGLMGIPAVAENVGSVSEVIKNGKTGFLVSGNKQRIDALNQLSGDYKLTSEMGISAKKYCEYEFGLREFLDSQLAAYGKAIRARS